MPAIAVREWVDLDQAVMEAHGNFVGRIRLVADPRLRIVEQLAQSGRNLMERDPAITLGLAEGAGPSPYVGEHLSVQA